MFVCHIFGFQQGFIHVLKDLSYDECNEVKFTPCTNPLCLDSMDCIE
jgi:hypothetical protein